MRGQQTRSGRSQAPASVGQQPATTTPTQTQQVAPSLKAWVKSPPKLLVAVGLVILIYVFFGPRGCREEVQPPAPSLGVSKPGEREPGKAAGKSPTAGDEASGTVVGGPKVVVSNVSPTVVENWMLQNMVGQAQGWELLQLVCEGTVTRYGTIPLPISPACFPKGNIECSLLRFGGGYAYLWDPFLVRQDGKHLKHITSSSESFGLSPDVVSVFIACEDPVTVMGGTKVGQENVTVFDYRVELHPGPNVGLWLGSQKRMVQFPALASPGLLPLRLPGSSGKEECVDWVMHLTMLPYEQVVSGEDLVKETISPPGFYQLYGYQVWLLPSDAPLVDEKWSYDQQMEMVKNRAVFTKLLRPSPEERDSLTRDHFKLTSQEVREGWRQYSIHEPASVRVYLEVRTPTLARWEVTFPLGKSSGEQVK